MFVQVEEYSEMKYVGQVGFMKEGSLVIGKMDV